MLCSMLGGAKPAPLVVPSGPAFVQQSPPATVTGTQATASLPAASTAGSLLIGVVVVEKQTTGTYTITLPTGWLFAATAEDVGFGAHPKTIIAYRQNAPATTDILVTSSLSADIVAIVYEWAGMATSGVFDKQSVDASSTAAASCDSGLTPLTTQANELVIGVVANRIQGTGQISFAPTDFDQRDMVTSTNATNTNTCRVSSHSKAVSAIGQYSIGATFSTARQYAAAVATFKAAA